MNKNKQEAKIDGHQSLTFPSYASLVHRLLKGAGGAYWSDEPVGLVVNTRVEKRYLVISFGSYFCSIDTKITET